MSGLGMGWAAHTFLALVFHFQGTQAGKLERFILSNLFSAATQTASSVSIYLSINQRNRARRRHQHIPEVDFPGFRGFVSKN